MFGLKKSLGISKGRCLFTIQNRNVKGHKKTIKNLYAAARGGGT